MENKKGGLFFFVTIGLIVGSALIKKFDFQTLTFEKPALAVVYMLTLAFCIYGIIKSYKKSSEK